MTAATEAAAKISFEVFTTAISPLRRYCALNDKHRRPGILSAHAKFSTVRRGDDCGKVAGFVGKVLMTQ
jgi:hypothetical protein